MSQILLGLCSGMVSKMTDRMEYLKSHMYGSSSMLGNFNLYTINSTTFKISEPFTLFLDHSVQFTYEQQFTFTRGVAF